MMFDDKAFVEYCERRGYKLCAVARAMEINPATLHRKRKGVFDFTVTEISRFLNFCGESIESPEMKRIFFA